MMWFGMIVGYAVDDLRDAVLQYVGEQRQSTMLPLYRLTFRQIELRSGILYIRGGGAPLRRVSGVISPRRNPISRSSLTTLCNLHMY
jgi:hypothetical protein